MELSLSTPEMMALRRELLANVHGAVLEIGIGPGLNLGCYPIAVRQISAVDVHSELPSVAVERARRSGLRVDYRPGSAERLPFDAGSLDSVVTTWSMCSIPDVDRAASEMFRVLKPGGRVYFVEHGLSPDAWVRFCQFRLNPLQRVIGAGCNLTRPIPAILQNAGFGIENLKTFYTSIWPRTHGYTFMGQALKGS
jgi:ubiquinone/menaquinone biosynthesis C-methylase UbiE